MKLNNKGFAITAVLYGLLILFVFLVGSYLTVLTSKKNRIDKISSEIEGVFYDYKLPKEYQYVPYIESDGTQYIDTGIVMKRADSVSISFYADFFNDSWGGGNGYTQFKGSDVGNDKKHVSIEYDGNTNIEKIKIDDSYKVTNNWNEQNYWEDNIKIGIFRLGDKNNAWYDGNTTYQIGKIYYYEDIDVNGEIVRRFATCYRKSDKKAGLYDFITKEFYTNESGNNFSYSEEDLNE